MDFPFQGEYWGVGLWMLLLILLGDWVKKKNWLDTESEKGIQFWSAMYIPVVIAMASTQNIKAAYIMGYSDPRSAATIGAGACTFIVGPITGSALGAPSEVIALSIAIGVIKTIVVTILTPIIASRIQLNNPQTAMIYGGLIGTTSGVAAGLASTDPKLVPYGALIATFYTGLGCLLCPSVLYFLLDWVL